MGAEAVLAAVAWTCPVHTILGPCPKDHKVKVLPGILQHQAKAGAFAQGLSKG